ncbi:sulfotransferase [Limnobacter sp. MED105]|uniref:sulfotransferase family protein n=1 Tax=Limnobacter sp. MED105 TaxID=391597 RepID=UPI000156C4F4|nr:sulfotransferase [Limnobacter sp. MED105]EDM85037.1 sulfotransferase [Limnobacter sp. MED105]
MVKDLDFLVIGAQKSATTYLQFALSDHPLIFMPKGEISFFEDPDYDVEKFDQIFDGLFPQDSNQLFLGIKRPNYLGKPEVPQRVAHHFPNAKIIAVLRNPVDRFVSAYFHYARGGFVPVEPIDLAIEKILYCKEYQSKYKRSAEIVEFGLYSKYLNLYSSYYERGLLKLVTHDQMLNDPDLVIKDIYHFIGVDESYKPTTMSERPQLVIYNVTRLKLLRMFNMLTSRYNSDFTRGYGKKSVFHKILSKLYEYFDAFVMSKFFENNKPRLSVKSRLILRDVYKEDVRVLKAKYGIDISDWDCS